MDVGFVIWVNLDHCLELSMMRMGSKLINVMTILGNEGGAFSGYMSIHYNVREALKSFEFICLLLVVPTCIVSRSVNTFYMNLLYVSWK